MSHRGQKQQIIKVARSTEQVACGGWVVCLRFCIEVIQKAALHEAVGLHILVMVDGPVAVGIV